MRLERIVPFLVLTVFLDLVGFGIILPLLPSYIGDMGGSAQTVGVLLSSFAGAQFIATPIIGWISDRYGRRRVIVISLGANAVAMALFSLAVMRHALWLLFASRLIAGTTSGNIGACQAAIADISEGAERVKAMGKIGAGIGLGMMLGPWIGGQVSRLGQAAPPLFAGAMAIVALLGVMAFLPETNPSVGAEAARVSTPSKAPPKPKLRFAALASNPKIALIMGLYFLTFFYMTTMQTALALTAHDRYDWGKDKIGNLFGIFGLVSLIVQVAIVGPASKRFGSVHVVMGAAVLSAVGLAIIGFSTVVTVMLGGLVLFAAAIGLTQPQLSSLASEYAGRSQQGLVLGFAQSSGSLARTLGPLLWGALYQHFGPVTAFLGGSVAALAACVVARAAK